MLKELAGKKGVVLLVVLATVMVTVILAGAILSIISSQSKLTHHQVSRIQAFYACSAGINFAREKLRLPVSEGGWTTNQCPSPAGCDLPNDVDFPSTINQPVKIIITPSGLDGCLNPPPGSAVCISAKVTYPSS